MIGVFAAVIGLLLYLLGVVALFLMSVSKFIDYDQIRGTLYGAGALVAVAVLITFSIMYAGSDPYANQLCLAGHQEWRTERGAKGETYRVKAWVCSQWEAK